MRQIEDKYKGKDFAKLREQVEVEQVPRAYPTPTWSLPRAYLACPVPICCLPAAYQPPAQR
eukprot:1815135-Rhodomonas_salina.1